MVPVGQRAGRRVGAQVGVEPARLGAAVDGAAVAVEGHDVPGAEVIAVPALSRLPGGGAEVPEVAGGLRRVVVVVARHRMGTVLEPAPGGVVALLVVGRAAAGV